MLIHQDTGFALISAAGAFAPTAGFTAPLLCAA
jgi:hypothetical protein